MTLADTTCKSALFLLARSSSSRICPLCMGRGLRIRESSQMLVLTLARDFVNTQKLQLIEDLQDTSKWDLDVVEAAADKQQSYEPEVDAEANEWDVRGDGGLLLNVMLERMESSVFNEDEDPYLAAKETLLLPRPRDSIEREKLQLTKDVQASLEEEDED